MRNNAEDFVGSAPKAGKRRAPSAEHSDLTRPRNAWCALGVEERVMKSSVLRLTRWPACRVLSIVVRLGGLPSANAEYIRAWGENSYDQSDVPAGSHYVAVDGGLRDSVALRADGSLVSWGEMWSDTTRVPPGNDFVAIDVGYWRGLALRRDRSLVGCGRNHDGEATPPPGNHFVGVSAGTSFSLALKEDGSLVSWGWNDYGQAAVPPGNDYVAISAGIDHALALRKDGSVVGWGITATGKRIRRRATTSLPSPRGWVIVWPCAPTGRWSGGARTTTTKSTFPRGVISPPSPAATTTAWR